MKLRELLIERISRKVYHYTRMGSAVNILSSGNFKLSSVVGSGFESELNPRKYPYFLSTTRTRHGGYHDPYVDGVMFNLNGEYYNQHYKGIPVDYWGERGKQHEYGRRSEAEDRIVSSKPEISIDGVEEIHVYLKPISPEAVQKEYAYLPPQVRQVFLLSKKRNIPIYLYIDVNAWMNQQKGKSVGIADHPLFKGFKKPNKMRRSVDYLEPWLEIIYKDSTDKLSERAAKLAYNLVYYYRGGSGGFDSDFSNARKPSSEGYETLTKLIKYMRSHKMNELSDFVKAMHEKWKTIKTNEYAAKNPPTE